MAAKKRGRKPTEERASTPTELIAMMRRWARTVLPTDDEEYLRAIARPIVASDDSKARHKKAVLLSAAIRKQLALAREFLSKDCDIAIGEEPDPQTANTAVGHLWKFLRDVHVKEYGLKHIAPIPNDVDDRVWTEKELTAEQEGQLNKLQKYSRSLDPKNREWKKGLDIFVAELANPVGRNGNVSFEYGYVKTMEELEAAAVLAGFFDPMLARRTISAAEKSGEEGATVARGASQLRIELRRALKIRKPKKAPE